jgi:hypothetical protein
LVSLLEQSFHVVIYGNHFLVSLVNIALELAKHFVLESSLIIKVLRFTGDGLGDANNFVKLSILPR